MDLMLFIFFLNFAFRYFEKQFAVSEETKLPLFLHCRNSAEDFADILKRNRERFTEGVVNQTHYNFPFC